MRNNVFAELKSTVHYTNRSGVRATCPDCHAPHNWTDKVARKMAAIKEVLGTIAGTINTPDAVAGDEEPSVSRARDGNVPVFQGVYPVPMLCGVS